MAELSTSTVTKPLSIPAGALGEQSAIYWMSGLGGKSWYAVCVRSRHENLAATHLAARGIEYFLPLYGAIHRWHDRRKVVQLPLFPGYLFVRIAWPQRLQVQTVPGIIAIVGCKDRGTPIPEEEIATIQESLGRGGRVEPHPYLKVGQKVLIKDGPLRGVEGILVRVNQRPRVVLSIHLIQRAVAVEVDEADLKLC